MRTPALKQAAFFLHFIKQHVSVIANNFIAKQLSSLFILLLVSNLVGLNRRNELEKISTSKKVELQSTPTDFI